MWWNATLLEHTTCFRAYRLYFFWQYQEANFCIGFTVTETGLCSKPTDHKAVSVKVQICVLKMPISTNNRTPEHREFFSDISGKYLDNISEWSSDHFLNNCHLLALNANDMHTLHKLVHTRSLRKVIHFCNHFIIHTCLCVWMCISVHVGTYMQWPCKFCNHSCVMCTALCLTVSFFAYLWGLT
jgi:hypothetical protein